MPKGFGWRALRPKFGGEARGRGGQKQKRAQDPLTKRELPGVRISPQNTPKKQKAPENPRLLVTMARPERFELPTLRIEVCMTP